MSEQDTIAELKEKVLALEADVDSLLSTDATKAILQRLADTIAERDKLRGTLAARNEDLKRIQTALEALLEQHGHCEEEHAALSKNHDDLRKMAQGLRQRLDDLGTVRLAGMNHLAVLGDYTETLRNLLTHPSASTGLPLHPPSLQEELVRVEQRITTLVPQVSEEWDQASVISDAIQDASEKWRYELLRAHQGSKAEEKDAYDRAIAEEKTVEHLRAKHIKQDQRARVFETRLRTLEKYRDALTLAMTGIHED